ncbi:MAG: hypothetical protein K0R39_3024 [Symbiobacteriaceae bacterium]|nr:hypothetical protein [Symbiobacteriaceae bacterium]
MRFSHSAGTPPPEAGGGHRRYRSAGKEPNYRCRQLHPDHVHKEIEIAVALCSFWGAKTSESARRQGGYPRASADNGQDLRQDPGRNRAGTPPHPCRHCAEVKPPGCRHCAATKPQPSQPPCRNQASPHAATKPQPCRHQADTKPTPSRNQASPHAATKPQPCRNHADTKPTPC